MAWYSTCCMRTDTNINSRNDQHIVQYQYYQYYDYYPAARLSVCRCLYLLFAQQLKIN